jgi:uncharacterized membrane protein
VADRITHTSGGDAPLSAAKHPDPSVLEDAAASSDELIGRALTIARSREELYRFWRNLENFPRFMENVVSVRMLDDRRSHWVVEAPGGRTVEWESEIVEDIPNELLSWRSVEGADVEHSGRIEFRDAQGNRGTVMTVTLLYDPPAGKLGKLIAKLFQEEPRIQSRRDLRRFKQLMETGEITTSIRNLSEAEKKSVGVSRPTEH